MKLYCDASTSGKYSGIAAIAVNSSGVIVDRWGKRMETASSSEAEVKAIEMSMEAGELCFNGCDIYTDFESFTKNKKTLPGAMDSYLGNFIWIPRKDNALADSLSRAELRNIPWRIEYKIAEELRVFDGLTPGIWYVNGKDAEQTVRYDGEKFRCTCGNPFMEYKLLCRHLIAVFQRMNIINDTGEIKLKLR